MKQKSKLDSGFSYGIHIPDAATKKNPRKNHLYDGVPNKKQVRFFKRRGSENDRLVWNEKYLWKKECRNKPQRKGPISRSYGWKLFEQVYRIKKQIILVRQTLQKSFWRVTSKEILEAWKEEQRLERKIVEIKKNALSWFLKDPEELDPRLRVYRRRFGNPKKRIFPEGFYEFNSQEEFLNFKRGDVVGIQSEGTFHCISPIFEENTENYKEKEVPSLGFYTQEQFEKINTDISEMFSEEDFCTYGDSNPSGGLDKLDMHEDAKWLQSYYPKSIDAIESHEKFLLKQGEVGKKIHYGDKEIILLMSTRSKSLKRFLLKNKKLI